MYINNEHIHQDMGASCKRNLTVNPSSPSKLFERMVDQTVDQYREGDYDSQHISHVYHSILTHNNIHP